MKYYSGNEGMNEEKKRECGRGRAEDEREEGEEVERKHKRCRLDRRRCFLRQELVALNAAVGGTGPLPLLAAPGLAAPISVVSVTITARDADDPFDDDFELGAISCERIRILLNFTSIINLPLAAVATLNFQLFRSTFEAAAQAIGPTFSFAATAPAAVGEAVSFNFQFLDSDLPPGTYTYTVVLTPGALVTVAGASITNAVLGAVAVEFG